MNKILTLIAALVFALMSTTYSQVTLPHFISNGMVLQHDHPVNIRGHAAAHGTPLPLP